MVDRDGSDVDKLGEVVLVRHVVSVPGYDIEGTVALGTLEELAAQLVRDGPRIVVGNLICGDRMQEVAGIGQAVCTERPKFWQLEIGTPNLEDVAPRGAFDPDLESLATLDHADFARLYVQEAKLGLNIESTLLRHDEKVSVRVDKGSLLHALVTQKDVRGQAFPKSWVARSSKSLEAVHKVYLLCCGDLEGLPSQLSGGNVDARVDGQKVRFSIGVVRQIYLRDGHC